MILNRKYEDCTLFFIKRQNNVPNIYTCIYNMSLEHLTLCVGDLKNPSSTSI